MEFFIKKFEKYINKILSTDEETLYALRKLENKVMKWIINILFKKKYHSPQSEYLVQKILLKKYLLR